MTAADLYEEITEKWAALREEVVFQQKRVEELEQALLDKQVEAASMTVLREIGVKRIEELERILSSAREYAEDVQQVESTFAKDMYLRHLIDILGEKPAPASECATCGGAGTLKWKSRAARKRSRKHPYLDVPCPDCAKE